MFTARLTRRFASAAALAALLAPSLYGQSLPTNAVPSVRPGFEISRWAREPMLRSPVAMSFDDLGRLYVVETARRGTVDIDIRGHADWIVDDLANQSVDDLRRFFRTRMAPERSVPNAPWLRDYNGDGVHDWQDLTGVKERVHRLEDTTGRGRADRATVFAEGFNEEINGVIAGVMPWKNQVFVTIYPDLWSLQDTDGDGRADRQDSWFRGFGVHAAFDGHDLHGLIAGPDGKIYFTNGDNGFSVTNREGRRLHFPNTGGVLRMNPDGTQLEVFASGLRNPQEIAFDEFGNMFAVDNDGDLGDERERFVYITEGSDSGWRLHWQFRDAGWSRHTQRPEYNPWTAERMWVPPFPGQPAYLTPAITNYSVGPGSIRYNPGTALNEAYRGHFFLIEFPVQKVSTFQARPKGAGFEMVGDHTFVFGMMASALDFGPDGALYIGDWDGLWSPSGKGSVWRLDDPRVAGTPLRQEVRRLLAEGMAQRSVAELTTLLGHADQRLRSRAQFELVNRREVERLRQIARDTSQPRFARIHALWGLGQSRAQVSPETFPWTDADPELRAQSAKVAGDLGLQPASADVLKLLRDPEPRVKFHAAIALGKLGERRAFPGLVTLLEENRDQDTFLRHAAVMGLVGAASLEQIAGLAQHASVSVRLGAVVALRRLHSPTVSVFLRDSEPTVLRETVRAIHDDDSIPAALPELASRLDRTLPTADESVWRRVLNANLRVGTEEAAERLVTFAALSSNPAAARLEAIACLADWGRTQALDRVEGLMRHLPPRPADAGDRRIREHFDALLTGADEALTRTLARVVMENSIDVPTSAFRSWVASPKQPATVRVQALELLARRKDAGFQEALQLALNDPVEPLRLAAWRWFAREDAAKFLAQAQVREADWTLREKQLALQLAAQLPGNVGVPYLTARLEALTAGRLPTELALDVLEAVKASQNPALQETLTRYEKAPASADPIDRYRPALRGGDPANGKALFRNHPNAQCVRCHDAGGEGQQAGPVLAGIGKRATPEYLLAALIDPSRQIAEGFGSLTVVLRNGDSFDGIKLRESPTELVFRQGTGELRTVMKSELERMISNTVSSMPPMGEVLTPFELRDILAYLQSWN